MEIPDIKIHTNNPATSFYRNNLQVTTLGVPIVAQQVKNLTAMAGVAAETGVAAEAGFDTQPSAVD